MSFKLGNVKKREQEQVFALGGRLLPDFKTWVIPDELQDINGLAPWLPCEEGFIVQRPYFVLRAKCSCWKCGQETPVVALGARRFQHLTYETSDMPVWRREEKPVLFTEVGYLDETISRSMQENYGFFRQLYLEEREIEEWGNCCVHCGSMQEANDDWRYDFRSPFNPQSVEEAREVRGVYFNLPFDYYINAGDSYGTLWDEMIR